VLHGRRNEQTAIAELLAHAHQGGSGALTLRGEPGVGKSALLDHAAQTAGGMRVLRVMGIESEAELPFAGLHLLLRPVLDRVAGLPQAQAAALRGALGLGAATAEDRFLVGLAVLMLMSELAEDRPLLCLVDDAQWLDRNSVEALTFAARRLDSEGVAVLVATRVTESERAMPGLPELHLGGLDTDAARALLAERGGEMAPSVRDRIIDETAGNPLALIELPGILTVEQRAGRLRPAGLQGGSLPLPRRVRDVFEARLTDLPDETRVLLTVVAAEETGDLGTILAAGRACGVTLAALDDAEQAGHVVITDATVAFRHPLMRSAAYQTAPFSTRLAAHRALADVLRAPDQADRRAWHLAAGATGPDESVATALEAAARRARGRRGNAAAASAYERAAGLSADEANRNRRLVLAAEAAGDAGEFAWAKTTADQAGRLVDDREMRARLDYVRAAIEFEQGSPSNAHGMLLSAAAAITETAPARAASLLVEAVRNAWYSSNATLAAQAVLALAEIRLPPADPLEPLATAVSAIARFIVGVPGPGLEPIRDLVQTSRFSPSANPSERLIIASLGFVVTDDEASLELAESFATDCRRRGMIGWLPHALQLVARAQLYLCRHRDAIASAAEGLRIAEDTGQHHRASHLRGISALLAAVTGDDQRCRALADEAIGYAVAHDIGPSAAWGTWALASLDLGQGRADLALTRFEAAPVDLYLPLPAVFVAADHVEAAVRAGRPEQAKEPLERFTGWSEKFGLPWSAALVERCRALMAPDDEAEQHYLAAIRLHHASGRPFESARTKLLYGEWLRRARRRSDARLHLHAALGVFERSDAQPWVTRARAELRATGEVTAQPDRQGLLARLTPQELQIVRLAGDGLTNRDIAAQLFISPRTVGYHLYKAYPKLGIGSRVELARLGGRFLEDSA
jgi:DNA-binding CsgD family transcriptional regulator